MAGIRPHFLLILAVFLVLGNAAFSFDKFKSEEEAQKEFDAMYGADGNAIDENAYKITTAFKEDESNSIRKFIEYLIKHPNEIVYVVCGSGGAQEDAASLIKSYIGRMRGYTVTGAETDETGISIVQDYKMKMSMLLNYKCIIFGSSSNNSFIKTMQDRKEVQISDNKAQFKLLNNPNSLVIACTRDDMFVELVRVLLRSYDTFDDDVYSYFFIN
ncbi:MAG: hypothetical protein A2268_14160 [Candidatus Raymondbacteria bacterium RifOxyA12_full_50_37]|uniref:Uncharacterized protein n=1 Tax=Candidatus Raymondbacteria bacterium RIFOXYD12_FULL_49_13 TaxID=1817890 RepID=A0A1F7FKW3_UNCRA|nr:MAG: hypothetical protein A2268_14160 [Candidatus Raymondbacteria bacterium RifOxyA12_full_50_37]OGJ86903.1 MAG: hypothetical protein A2350_02070 [Candidatus Raymondbacteria bacterium RifOxyB12_full_50_8]OGJ88223.1 MAG: hypothetical protein A2248_19500 [Candidatus Raymondbacteria bacterium RIFOXYA2_FULL_49_16]OGJ97090.1 MAG: hypothetical protein A2487_05810 [Candidatus Raymondbacteria bacterium RifOxyC12_full_50_8]OGK07268.1 MAG: hypothetical protein A2519_14170 [Candidatus Raymondbacteria b